MKKSMRLMRGIEETSAEQEKLKTETLAKNRMPSLLACVYIEIGAVPLLHNLPMNRPEQLVQVAKFSDSEIKRANK